MVVYFLLALVFSIIIVLTVIDKFFPKEYESLPSKTLKDIYKYGMISFAGAFTLTFIVLGIYDALKINGNELNGLKIVGIVLLIASICLTIGVNIYFVLTKRDYYRSALNQEEEKENVNE